MRFAKEKIQGRTGSGIAFPALAIRIREWVEIPQMRRSIQKVDTLQSVYVSGLKLTVSDNQYYFNQALQSVYVSGLKYVLGMTQFTADFFLQSVYVRELKYVMFYT